MVSIFSKNMNILAASMDKGRREVRDEGLSKIEWKAGRKVRIMADINVWTKAGGGDKEEGREEGKEEGRDESGDAGTDKGRWEVSHEGLSKRERKAGRQVRMMAQMIVWTKAGGGTRRKAGGGRKGGRQGGRKGGRQG